MKLRIEPLTPALCAVTATPTWWERLFRIRGYEERFASLHGQVWLWDSTAARCEPPVADAIERAYRGVEWRPLRIV